MIWNNGERNVKEKEAIVKQLKRRDGKGLLALVGVGVWAMKAATYEYTEATWSSLRCTISSSTTDYKRMHLNWGK